MSTHLQQGQIAEEVASRIAISDLVAKYCHGCDDHDLETWLSIWSDDVVYAAPNVLGTFEGTKGIREAADVIWSALPVTKHWTTNLLLDFDGPDRAKGRSDVTFDCEDTEGRTMFGAATYHDIFERRDGSWRIVRREIVVHYQKLIEIRPFE
ncbi:MAG TPA: nuclear transport factor 2 family protein [Aestuariivirgaceae bacterium]|nr:nuclear transport factor 2 family protein [Aestuariivirgaceae bacterium]